MIESTWSLSLYIWKSFDMRRLLYIVTWLHCEWLDTHQVFEADWLADCPTASTPSWMHSVEIELLLLCWESDTNWMLILFDRCNNFNSSSSSSCERSQIDIHWTLEFHRTRGRVLYSTVLYRIVQYRYIHLQRITSQIRMIVDYIRHSKRQLSCIYNSLFTLMYFKLPILSQL